MAAALPLLLVFALGVDSQLEVGLRTEVRAHRTDPPPTPDQARGVDLAASPHFLLRLLGGGDSLQLSYTPRFTERNIGPNGLYEYMHEAELRLHVSPDPTWSFEAFAGGAAGRTDLVTENLVSSASAGGGTGGGPGTSTSISNVTSTRAIDIERLRAGLSLRADPSRRDEYLASASGIFDGGANASSREAYPIAHIVDAAAEYRHAVTRLDQLGVRLSGEWGNVPSLRATSVTSTALALLRHRFSPELETWGGAGAVFLFSRVEATPPASPSRVREIRPAAELGLVRTPPPRPPPSAEAEGPATVQPILHPSLRDYTADAVAHLGAAMDRNTGIASPQLDGTAGLSLPVSERFSLLARGTGVVTWPQGGGTRTATLNLGGRYAFLQRVLLEAGAYGTWQHSYARTAQTLQPSFHEFGVFLALTLDAPRASF
ncbi:MAG TPA: hypothetical protein VMU15_16875 [Anaeromyxobacter sp.]|nr:hypothetical protein [Anaeromyxobacter sp.]